MATDSSRYCSTPRGRTVKIKDMGCEIEQMNVINNNTSPTAVRKIVKLFADWYKNLIDDNRNSLGLYLSDDCTFQWFGRSITEKKNIIGFANSDMSCNSHIFLSVKPCSSIPLYNEKPIPSFRLNNEDSYDDLAIPMNDCPPNILKLLNQSSLMNSTQNQKRCSPRSPQSPKNDVVRKRSRKDKLNNVILNNNTIKYNLRSSSKKIINNISSLSENKCSSPSKNKNDNKLMESPKICMEATLNLQFTSIRNKRGANIYKWERPCKLQVEFSENRMCVGEYTIWTIVYSDNNKCRRNLLAAFDAVGD